MEKVLHITEEGGNFDFFNLESNCLDLENTGRIIGEIRKKIFSLEDISINDKRICNILNCLELPIHGISDMNFYSIENIAYFIYGLSFNDIEESFLCHPFNKTIFLEGAKDFMTSFNDEEINKAAESTMTSINFILKKE